MKSHQSSPSGQGSRRGSRYRGEGRSSRSSERRSENGAKKAPPSLWHKIVSFFKGGAKSAPAPKRMADPAPATAERKPRESRESAGNGRTARKPEAVEVTTPRLYVGNLSFDATESDLSELFNGVGQVVNVEVVSHKQTQRSKGFAFVQMQTTDEAKRAVGELHDKEFMGRKLVVSGAKNTDQHDGRSEPRFAA